MLVYGKNVARDLLKKNKYIKKIIIQDNFDDKEIISLIEKNKISVKRCSKREIDHLCSGLHQGIILDIPDYKYHGLHDIIQNDEIDFVVLLDHLEDPMMRSIWSLVVFSSVEFGTNGSASGSCSTTGCRPSAMSMTSESSTVGRTYPAASARSASDSVASSSPMARAVSWISAVFAAAAATVSRNIRCSIATARSWAPVTFLSSEKQH